MISAVTTFSILWALGSGEDYYYQGNVSRTTLSDIAAYRSVLTLDWLKAEDSRQSEIAAAFETVPSPPARVFTTDCIGYPRPAPGKIAKLMVELLRNLEGDEGVVIPEFIRSLIRAKMLLETALFDSEPDLESLVKTPGVMAGEPHATFPRILAMIWMSITDPATTKTQGWCTVYKVNKYLLTAKSSDIAKHLRSLDPIIARARFIMEDFIQNVTPLNMYQQKTIPSVKTTIKEVLPRKGAKRPTRNKQAFDDLPPPPQFPVAQAAELPELIKFPSNFSSLDILQNLPSVFDDDVLETNNAILPQWPSVSDDVDLEPEIQKETSWVFRENKRTDSIHLCNKIKPNVKDIVRRFYAVLPYFDKDHFNTAFLHKYRGTVYGMSEAADMLDREAAFYAVVLTPLVFLQQYRDTWCLLERFHRAMRLYQISHPTEKRPALKLLQNFRAVNHKIKSFIADLPEIEATKRLSPLRTTLDPDDEELHDKTDIRYLKELIKNLG